MKRKLLCFILCFAVCMTLLPISAFAGDSDVVNVPDAVLKQYLNSMLGRAADSDLTEKDLRSIKKFDYSGRYGQLTDLEGIQYCTELTFFRIYGGGTPKNCQLLGNCKKMTFLAIMYSWLEDISFVSELTELTYIDFYNCEINDISAIGKLSKLTVLDVMGNHVLDMSPMKNMVPQMTHLYGLNESASITLDCTKEENGYCIFDNPVIGIDAAPVVPNSLTGCEYDAVTNTFKVSTGTASFSFTTSQPTIANSGDFQNHFKTSVKVTCNHPPKTGSLTVSNKLEGNSIEADKKFSFDITLGDRAVNGSFSGVDFVNGVGTVSLGDGESIAIDGLPDQMGFTVTEVDPGDYICSAPNGISGTIDYLNPAFAAFTNTRDVFYRVSYDVKGDPIYGTPDDAAAPVDTREYAPNESVTVAEVPVSRQDYGVDLKTGEHVTGRWSFDSWDRTDFQIVENTIISGSWIFTPDRRTGNLSVANTVSGTAADSTKAFEFTVALADKTICGTYGGMSFDMGVATFTLRGGENISALGLPAGVEYTVTEADYTADGYVTAQNGESGTITAGSTAEAVFTNTKTSAAPGPVLTPTPEPTPTPNPTPTPTNPKTGDTTPIFLWLVLLMVGAIGAVGTIVFSRKRKKN